MNRAAAAKSNGAHSNGPVTEAGKTISSGNAIRHGLTASQVVIPGENPAEYDALVQAFEDEFRPMTLREDDLLSEMAAARWRLRRLPVMEQATFAVEFERVRKEAVSEHLTPEQEHARAWSAVTLSPAMKQIHRHETRLRRAYEKARIELDFLIDQRILGLLEAEELEAQELEAQELEAQEIDEAAQSGAAPAPGYHSAPRTSLLEPRNKTVQNEPAAISPATAAPAMVHPQKRAA